MNFVQRILGEMTGTASIGTVEVGMPSIVGTPLNTKRRPTLKGFAGSAKNKRRTASESMTADVAPTLTGVSPRILAKRRQETTSDSRPVGGRSYRYWPSKRGKSAVESILGEAEEKSLIPDDAEDLLSTSEIEAKNKPEIETEVLGSEDLLEPALALVAPDTTPNAARELDPSLVPNRDPALDTLLGKKPSSGPAIPNEGPKPSTVTRVESKTQDGDDLPSGEMPRPPGSFLKPIGGLNEGSESAKVELVVGSSQSIVGNAVAEGELGAASMPKPQEGNIQRTMDIFRRFHRI